MNTVIQTAAFEPGSRVLVVSDVHGPSRLLRRLLKKADYRPGEDYLILLGDMMEKSSDSLGTLREAMRLSRESSRVFVLMGNNDLWRYEQLSSCDDRLDEVLMTTTKQNTARWGGSLFSEMCRELDLPYETLADTACARLAVQTGFAEELAFLRSLPTVLVTERHIFVHGGLPCAEDALDTLLSRNAFDCLKYDNFLGDLAARSICFSRWVIVGHWPVALYRREICAHYPLIEPNRRVASIDGGCGLKRDGQLNALVIPDSREDRFDWLACDELSCVTALDAQEASVNPISINWGDNAVRVIEEEGAPYPGFCLIEHLRTGRRLTIPADDLYTAYDGQLCCRETTDYHLPVSAGDILSLVKQTAQGAIVKRAGVVGWYYGRLAGADADVGKI